MYIVAIAWMFVVVLMAAAEATSAQGTVLGAVFTLLLYGVLPLGLVLYIMGAPLRRQRHAEYQSREVSLKDALQTPHSAPPNGRSMATRDAIASEGKKP